ncbi:MAG: hypothetical protein WAO98_11195 [Alphaproteobacteria bacterium]
MKHAIITTTINVPENLNAYAKDLVDHGVKNACFVVTGDKKTPAATAEACAQIQKTYGISTEYMGVEEQNKFMARFPEYDSFLPWNCIQRRNVAILKAYADGADVIYTIDDDNFLHTPNYIGSHGSLGQVQQLDAVQSESGWFNVCTYLTERSGRQFFHRGYSYDHRVTPDPKTTTQKVSGRVVVNAGLWLGDPDVDAVTRLAIAPDVTESKLKTRIALAHGTKGPFNSQNTAVHRDVIPAYSMYFGVGRYDDILPSYFVKRIADHLKDYICFGMPLVRQTRNVHDLWIDADKERLGYQLTDRIVAWLYEITLKGNDYKSCMYEIIPALREKFRTAEKLTEDQKKFLDMIDKNCVAWLLAIDQADAKSKAA